MFKVSIWLKGGGKIVEECHIEQTEARELVDDVKHAISNGTRYDFLMVNRQEKDLMPIIVSYADIAAIQIDENKPIEHHGRKLETRNQ